MTYDLMIKILNNYQPANDKEEAAIKDMFADIRHQQYTYKKENPSVTCEQTFAIVDTSLLLDYDNAALYDTYGKLKREALTIDDEERTVIFKEFQQAARSDFNTLLTTNQLMAAYDFLQDLWSDNEAVGCNNPNGTFNRTCRYNGNQQVIDIDTETALKIRYVLEQARVRAVDTNANKSTIDELDRLMKLFD